MKLHNKPYFWNIFNSPLKFILSEEESFYKEAENELEISSLWDKHY